MRYVMRVCVVCERRFEANPKPLKGSMGRNKVRRGYNCVTCSRECSKLYWRGQKKKKWALKN